MLDKVTGFTERMGAEFATGWVNDPNMAPLPALVVARLGNEVLGHAFATFDRKDLPAGGKGFCIVFGRRLNPEDMDGLEVFGGNGTPLRRTAQCKMDSHDIRRVFVLGSPRSGTSQLGSCIAEAFQLNWLGEGHVAAAFAAMFSGANMINSNTGFLQVVQHMDLPGNVVMEARRAYFYAHGSCSFLDKTPGIEMIKSLPLLIAAFPDSRFIFAKRNGISNVLSRMQKFGGPMRSHCEDWRGAMEAWRYSKTHLTNYIEVDQEDMLHYPDQVAQRICRYLDDESATDRLLHLMQTRSEERTGAGIDRTRLSQTNWTVDEAMMFVTICGDMMRAYNYEIRL
jgi:hypothetical protein